MAKNPFNGVIPILNVKNVVKSIQYYEEALGFTLDWKWENPATFASVSREKVSIFLCQNAQGQSGTWMSVFVEDVDALHQEYQTTGAIIVQPPTNFPWGIREMNVEDLDGHRLRMGSDADEPVDTSTLPS